MFQGGQSNFQSPRQYSDQAVWHFDYAFGSDANDGLTPGTSLKTFMEYTRRVGLHPQLYQRVDYYIHGDMHQTDAMLIDGVMLTAGEQHVHFVPMVLHTGSLTGVINYDQVTGQWNELQETGFDFTPHVGRLIEVTTGDPTMGPTQCWILKALGLGRARVGFYSARPLNSFGMWIATGGVIGNSYSILQLPKACTLILDPITSICLPYANVQDIARPVSFSTGDFSYSLRANILTRTDDLTIFLSCVMSRTLLGNAAQLDNPLFAGPGGAYLEDGCVLSQASFLNVPYVYVTGLTISYGIMLQSTQIVTNALYDGAPTACIHVHHHILGIGIFDTDSALQFYEGGTFLIEGTLWGQGNTGPIIQLDRGGRFINDGVQPLYAKTSDPIEMRVGGRSAGPATEIANPYGYTTDRDYTFANYMATVAAGGFGRKIFDPNMPATFVVG